MHLAWRALRDFLCDLFTAGGAVGGYEGTKSPVDEVDLLMKIAESLPGVSTRFGFLSDFLDFLNTARCF